MIEHLKSVFRSIYFYWFILYKKIGKKNTKTLLFFKKNVKGDPKNIGLENICRKFLCEKKTINCFDNFYFIFYFL